jgi:hypothetical protein
MKALTVQQPYAWAIAFGGKPVENRRQRWKYRGPLAIHAGARWASYAADDMRIVLAVANDPDPRHLYTFGAILAVVDLVDVHADAACCDPWGEHAAATPGDGSHTVVHLVLRDVRPLPEPVPASGRLGLWDLPGDVEESVRRQLTPDRIGRTAP